MCDIADRVTVRFDRTNIYEHCEWYTFPIDVQRLLPILIHNAQTSPVIKAFGNIDCSRETFKLVIIF